jgi:hypothetical protein
MFNLADIYAPKQISECDYTDIEITYDQLVKRCLSVRGKMQPTMFLPCGRRMVFRARNRMKRPYLVVNPKPDTAQDEMTVYLKTEK